MSEKRRSVASMVTLGVRDLAQERTFYRSLGWDLAFDSEDFVVFELRGALLALFPVEKLAEDAHAGPETGQGGIRSCVIINVDSPEEVDDFAEVVRQAGGKLSKEPTKAQFFEGRDAYFADPEGNYWEIAWAPPDNQVVVAARRAAGLSTSGA